MQRAAAAVAAGLAPEELSDDDPEENRAKAAMEQARASHAYRQCCCYGVAYTHGITYGMWVATKRGPTPRRPWSRRGGVGTQDAS
jgi:hypothetical protein